MTAIEFEGVWKRYLGASRRQAAWDALRIMLGADADSAGFFWALKDVSFALEPGEALGIIGPNGAGKTTILKLLSGITVPTRGNIGAHGRMGALINLGAGFHPELTGRENIYLNGVILGMSRREVARKFDAIVEFSGLHEYLDMPVKRYSAGMYARLGFAVAIHLEPDILLVDEVLAVGDSQFREKCYRKMWELIDDNRCLVFVSHNLWAVKSTCSRALFLNRGAIECDGTADDAIRAYEAWAVRDSESDDDSAGPDSGARPSGDRPVKIMSVELLNDSGQRTLRFEPTDSLVVRIRYETPTVHEPALFSVGAMRMDGLHCFTAFSDEQADGLVREAGTGTVEARLRTLSLLPGRYTVWVSAYRATRASPIGKVACASSTVEVEVTGQLKHGVLRGVFDNRAVWQVNPDKKGTSSDGES